MTTMADEQQTSREGVVFASPVQYGDLSSLKIKLDVDAADAIKALKAIQREARAAARALRELEAKIERMQKIEVEMDGRKIGEIVTPSARDLDAVNIAYTIVVDKDGNKTLVPSQLNGEIITSSVVAWIETGNDDVVINYTDKDGIPKSARTSGNVYIGVFKRKGDGCR